MKTLRAAAYVTIVGGTFSCFRLTQAIRAEIAYSGPHYLPNTVPLFLALAALSFVVIWCGVLFLRHPSRGTAANAARASIYATWILLAGAHVGPGSCLFIVCLTYFFLKRAVVHQFGSETPNQTPGPAAW